MVEMALERLDRVVALDEDRTAAMVSNLLVVLCGDPHRGREHRQPLHLTKGQVDEFGDRDINRSTWPVYAGQA